MNYGLLFRTVKHLKLIQIIHQLKNRVWKHRLKSYTAPGETTLFRCEWIVKPTCCRANKLTFLNITEDFSNWGDRRNGMLWLYNLNYMDWLCQPDIDELTGLQWIDRFIFDLPQNNVGLDPYPIALRTINWIKFFNRFPHSATESRRNSLYSQLRLLEKTLEYHLLGNHLLEDLYALYIGASYFNDSRLIAKATDLLLKELHEQILPDGAHYEQSPMYHCILLDRLLDCININPNKKMSEYAGLMLGHLDSIAWSDGTIPLLNDSANNIAPTPDELKTYALRLNIFWKRKALSECGYRNLKNNIFESIIDVGNIAATYQPGHTHADTFNFELRINGSPVIVDTGISTYEKNSRRQYERSTMAHNTVTPVEDSNSSEVWGGFRVGKRAQTEILTDSETYVRAKHSGFGRNKTHFREFRILDNQFKVTDHINGTAISRLHFSSDIDISSDGISFIRSNSFIVKIENAQKIEIVDAKVSEQYNRFKTVKKVNILFQDSLTMTFSL